MIRHRFLSLAFAACIAFAATVVLALERGFYRAVAFMFDALALPAHTLQGLFAAPLAGGPALAYDGPPVHSLRHEAGVSRRSAARNT